MGGCIMTSVYHAAVFMSLYLTWQEGHSGSSVDDKETFDMCFSKGGLTIHGLRTAQPSSTTTSKVACLLRAPERQQHLLGLTWLPAQVASMQGIAEKYRVTSEENRRLYNEVQDLKGNIRVFCRVRPAGATGDGSACELSAFSCGVSMQIGLRHS